MRLPWITPSPASPAHKPTAKLEMLFRLNDRQATHLAKGLCVKGRFGAVLAPPAVISELSSPRRPAAVQAFAAMPPAWL